VRRQDGARCRVAAQTLRRRRPPRSWSGSASRLERPTTLRREGAHDRNPHIPGRSDSTRPPLRGWSWPGRDRWRRALPTRAAVEEGIVPRRRRHAGWHGWDGRHGDVIPAFPSARLPRAAESRGPGAATLRGLVVCWGRGGAQRIRGFEACNAPQIVTRLEGHPALRPECGGQ